MSMTRLSTEVAIIGSSFAGSLLALCLRRQGIDVVLLDRQRHPRFALGESSTPAADLVLGTLCDRYGLSALKPLTQYGAWKRAYPRLRCGPKRGFSYFHHSLGEGFTTDRDHSHELLVTASAADEVSDTNWFRADVDAFFAGEATAAGARLLDQTEIRSIASSGRWHLSGVREGEPVAVQAEFLIDSSGLAAVLPRRLGLADLSGEMETHSRSLYAHFSGVRRWRDLIEQAGAAVEDHPFDCDAAALHHILDGSWMWVLPFDGDLTSVGLTLDPRLYPQAIGEQSAWEWDRLIADYPAVAEQLSGARLAAPFENVVGTGRLQRLWDVPSSASQQGWSLLPGTHGFVDAFFSTGIAHSMIGIERVAAAFEDRRRPRLFHERLGEHARLTARELRVIDRLVAASHATFGRPPDVLAAMTMLYFAAATTWEQRRAGGHRASAFLLADDAAFGRMVDESSSALRALLPRADDPLERQQFTSFVAQQIAPYNHAGLCEPAARNLYRYTGAAKAPLPAAGQPHSSPGAASAASISREL